MLKKILQVSHPFLLTVYPIVYLYNSNRDLVALSELVKTLAIGIVITAFWLFMLIRIFRDTVRGALFTSGLVVLFFSYGHVLNLVDLSRSQLSLIWFVLFVVLVFVIRRLWGKNRRRMMIFSENLSFIVLVLIAFNVVDVVRGELNTEQVQVENEVVLEEVAGDLPDIYYIVLDEYARNDVLLDTYGFDNSDFTDWLTGQGFFVADESLTNYMLTFLSLASTLNMDYHDFLDGNPDSVQKAYQILEDNQVVRTLKSLGYSYVHFSTGYEPTNTSQYADYYYDFADSDGGDVFGASGFQMMVMQTTLLEGVIHKRLDVESAHRAIYNFDILPEVTRIKNPTFTFVHFLVPHPAFVFVPDDAVSELGTATGIVDGEIVAPSPRKESDDYIQQLIFTNRAVQQTIEEILDRSSTSPIIILQSDHGYALRSEQRVAIGWDHEDYLRARVPILNAYYVSDEMKEKLYSAISPVNSFRLVFDTYFGTDLGLLDEYYYFTNYSGAENPEQITDLDR